MAELTPISRADLPICHDITPHQPNTGENTEEGKTVCPTCRGALWVHPRRADNSIDWGHVVPCPCLGQPTPYGVRRDRTFETFRVVVGTADAVRAARDFAIGKLTRLLIYGGIGNGKTHLCEAAATLMSKSGHLVPVYRCPEVLLNLQSAMNEGKLETAAREHEARPVLILDEFQVDWPSGILQTIINSRYNSSLPTMLTSNLDLENVPRRLVSRFNEQPGGLVVLNYAPDFRMS